MPSEGAAVNFTDCPTSSVAGDGEAVTSGGAYTVITALALCAFAAVMELVPVSVNITYMSLVAWTEGVNVFVAVVPVPVAPVILAALSYHCHVNDPVPPVTVDVNVSDWPISIVALAGELADVTVGAGLTVTVSVTLLTVTGVVALSVTYMQ